MIETVSIKNIALIEDIQINFRPGFTILTGETGAGKSILVGALGVLLGNKVDADIIRSGKEEASVSAVINIANHKEALSFLSSKAIETEDETVVLRRTIRRQGRGAISINSTPVTLQELSDFTDLLIDMHSQHAHQSLLRADNHRKLLDHFCDLDSEVATLSGYFYKFSELKEQRSELEKSQSQRDRDLDYLEFATNEIREANLKPSEDEEIESELGILNQSEKLFSKLEKFSSLVSGVNGGGLVLLREALGALESIVGIDENQSALLDRYQSAYYEIEDIASSLDEWKGRLDFSPQKIDQLNSRLALIKRLTKKYGGSIEAVLSFYKESMDKIQFLQNDTLSLEALDEEIAKVESQLRQIALKVSATRKEKAVILQNAICENLALLGMGNARFAIQIETREMEDGKPACGAYGIDVIRFLFSANVGEPLKELRLIASGGELSRVMLSIKSVFGTKDPISTLIFDEIDTGIGGAVARSIATHIAALGKCKQILCITHLAAIAAKATNHFKIEKEVKDGVTTTLVTPLEGEKRVKEIARMLSGDDSSSYSLDHAKELLNSI